MSKNARTTRRNVLQGGGALVAATAGLMALGASQQAQASTDIPASAEKKCATCRYWGGVRRVSTDKQTVSADGKGWCNNPNSPAYQKQTNPTQGAPVWTRWDALG
ncbi:MAG: hypothetical protein CMM62_20415 [Rhodospirillaceae bacterium]|nr:hypothetical protein [Rhodospirillaceae bacterium]MAX65160.1 hypothetical protein [Rhodospirillaceae bacterium]